MLTPDEIALAAVVEERDKLLAFKTWVHSFLDAHGVPPEFPDGPHTKEGCRIGDRMDWLVAERDAALAMLRRLADALAACMKGDNSFAAVETLTVARELLAKAEAQP